MANDKVYKEELHKPTMRGVEKNRMEVMEYERLGLPYKTFGELEVSNIEMQAMLLIQSGKKVSKKLEKALLETKEDRLNKRNTNEKNIDWASEKDAIEWLNS